MKIKPVRCVALIKPDKVDDKSAGGLYLPESTRDRMQYAVDRGVIIDVGEGFYEGLHGPVPQIGDTVLFDKYKGTLVDIREGNEVQKFRLLNDNEIIAILEE